MGKYPTSTPRKPPTNSILLNSALSKKIFQIFLKIVNYKIVARKKIRKKFKHILFLFKGNCYTMLETKVK